MRNEMLLGWRWWWYLYCCGITCIQAYPIKESGNNAKVVRTKQLNSEFSVPRYIFRHSTADKSMESFESDFTNDKEEISEEAVARNDERFLPLAMEPDAEMLPINYKGVKPPGVDHMELLSGEPQIISRDSKSSALLKRSNQHGNTEDTKESISEIGEKKTSDFQASSKGEMTEGRKKEESKEAAGAKKTHDVDEDNDSRSKNEAPRKDEARYEVRGDRTKNDNVSDFRNVYQKDGYKKNADFCDNGYQSGHSQTHGRCNEKHDAVEHTFQRDSNGDVGFDRAEERKGRELGELKSEKGNRNDGTKENYNFFHGFDEFVEKVGLAEEINYGLS